MRRTIATPAVTRPPAAEAIVGALSLPEADHPRKPPQPFPLSRLRLLPRETSMLYDIGRIDSSGRIISVRILSALSWRPGDGLDVAFVPGAVVMRQSADGHLRMPQRPRITVPASMRHALDVTPLDYVLLAAAPQYQLLIIYAMRTMDDMLVTFHSDIPEKTGGPGSG
jgi:hypothetical protein